MILLALLIQSAALQPSTKWLIEGEETMCAASRTYGTGDAAVMFAIKPVALATQVEVLFAEPQSPDVAGTGKGRIELVPSKAGFDVTYRFYRAKNGQRVTTILLDREPFMGALASASAVTLRVEKRPPVSVAATLTPPLAEQLGKCETMLAKSWGIDTVKTALVATPAKPIGSPAEWISNTDYPASAIAANQQGTTTILWTIGTDGKVSGCHPVQNSGFAALDAAACKALMKRGRYHPAKDAQGQPIESFQSRRAIWRLP